jgi:hypothetical protein
LSLLFKIGWFDQVRYDTGTARLEETEVFLMMINQQSMSNNENWPGRTFTKVDKDSNKNIVGKQRMAAC